MSRAGQPVIRYALPTFAATAPSAEARKSEKSTGPCCGWSSWTAAVRVATVASHSRWYSVAYASAGSVPGSVERQMMTIVGPGYDKMTYGDTPEHEEKELWRFRWVEAAGWPAAMAARALRLRSGHPAYSPNNHALIVCQLWGRFAAEGLSDEAAPSPMQRGRPRTARPSPASRTR